MLVIEMGVSRGRLVVGMAKQPADHWQGFLAHHGMAGEGMAQIVYAQFAKIGPLKDRPPKMLDAADRPAVLVIPEQPRNFRVARQTVDDLARRRTKPNRARTGLAVAQEETVALHVLPLEGENLAIAATGQQQQRSDAAPRSEREIVACAQVGKHLSKPRQFLGG